MNRRQVASSPGIGGRPGAHSEVVAENWKHSSCDGRKGVAKMKGDTQGRHYHNRKA